MIDLYTVIRISPFILYGFLQIKRKGSIEAAFLYSNMLINYFTYRLATFLFADIRAARICSQGPFLSLLAL